MCLFVLFNFSIPFFFVFPLFYTWSVVLKIYKGQISPNTHNDCFEVETNSLMYRKIVFRLWIFIYVNGLNGLLNHQLHQNYGFVTFNSNNNKKKTPTIPSIRVNTADLLFFYCPLSPHSIIIVKKMLSLNRNMRIVIIKLCLDIHTHTLTCIHFV